MEQNGGTWANATACSGRGGWGEDRRGRGGGRGGVVVRRAGDGLKRSTTAHEFTRSQPARIERADHIRRAHRGITGSSHRDDRVLVRLHCRGAVGRRHSVHNTPLEPQQLARGLSWTHHQHGRSSLKLQAAAPAAAAAAAAVPAPAPAARQCNTWTDLRCAVSWAQKGVGWCPLPLGIGSLPLWSLTVNSEHQRSGRGAPPRPSGAGTPSPLHCRIFRISGGRGVTVLRVL